jgi:hypothetical protein
MAPVCGNRVLLVLVGRTTTRSLRQRAAYGTEGRDYTSACCAERRERLGGLWRHAYRPMRRRAPTRLSPRRLCRDAFVDETRAVVARASSDCARFAPRNTMPSTPRVRDCVRGVLSGRRKPGTVVRAQQMGWCGWLALVEAQAGRPCRARSELRIHVNGRRGGAARHSSGAHGRRALLAARYGH